MLYNGEQIGDGTPPAVDIAVDPLEGTTLTAKGMPNALAVIALSERGSMFDPGPCVYMEKMAGGPEIADCLDLDRPIGETIELVAERKADATCATSWSSCSTARATRTASRRSATRARACGSSPTATSPPRCSRSATTRRSTCCGASAARRRASSPPPRSSAWAARSSAGCGRATTRSARPRSSGGYDLEKQLTADDLVRSDDCFFSATGVTDGDVLQGVRYQGSHGGAATTESLVMRSRSGTVRRVQRHARPHEAARAHRRARSAYG